MVVALWFIHRVKPTWLYRRSL